MRWTTGGLAPVLLTLAVGCGGKADDAPKSFFKELGTKDVAVGEGPDAAVGDTVLVEYTGTFPQGGEPFDSNASEDNSKDPLAFTIGERLVVKGFEDALVGMKRGGVRRVEIPWKFGYGEAGSPPKIPPKQDLVFEIKLLHLIKKGEENLFDSEDLKRGSGRAAANGDTVEVHYTAHYVNGKLVDDTRKRGKTVRFKIGDEEVISGVDIGVRGMAVGGVRKLVLPPATAWGMFGNTKTISGNQVLVIELELMKIE